MVILDPFFSSQYSHSTDNPSPEGVERLYRDLAISADESTTGLPESTLTRLKNRISAEPARVETDPQGHITSINPAFTELCGFTFPEIQGKKPGHFLQGPDTDREAVSVLREGVKTARRTEVEIINYHKNGAPYRVAITMEPVLDEHQELIGFRAVAEKRSLL